MKQTSALFFIFLFSFSTFPSYSNYPPSSSKILEDIEKLNVLGNVLYVAAHPDDENTGMITYFANERKMRTTYLSLTRGDGGQNLIGPEKFQWLGLIRTQELLEARKIDGGNQAFSRAYDFGYSKNPKETMEFWDGDTILKDVVWIIRKLRPDIIITRFSPDLGRRTHGHHTSSAILAKDAFLKSGDPNEYPEQMKWVSAWQPKKIFFNTSWWFYGTRDFDKSGLNEIETGQYNVLKGKSYGEISAESRSMHKSQGFGVMKERGSDLEYLKNFFDSTDQSDPLSGIETGWKRVEGGEEIGEMIQGAILTFDQQEPSKSVPLLLQIRKQIVSLQDEFWKRQKLQEIDKIIMDCLGVWVEPLCSKSEIVPGSKVGISFNSIQRAGDGIRLKMVRSPKMNFTSSIQELMELNQNFSFSDSLTVPEDLSFTVPYWLEKPIQKGRFQVDKQQQIGMAENDFEVPFEFIFDVEGEEITIRKPAIYKWRDRVNGEMIREVVIVPPLVACFNDKNILFPNQETKEVQVILNAQMKLKNANVKLDFPAGWKCDPMEIQVNMSEGEERRVNFQVTPPKAGNTASVGIKTTLGGKDYSLCKVQIDYPHIKHLTSVVDNRIDFIRMDISNNAKVVGYVDGAGDEIPQALAQLGSEVRYLDEEDFFNGTLDELDAIVMGVRSYNTVDWIPNVKENMMAFVEKGGNVVVQYNVSYGLITDDIGPFPLKISRDRVTDETAETTILNSKNRLFNSPNKIGLTDFDGWVQERGLYFPNEWDEKYEPLIAWNDPGEEETKGALLVASYGKGSFIYSGISWFRQLPAGVGGAYKLFANLISAKNGS